MTYTGPERKRTRLAEFDYREPGPYAITIVTQHRIHRFGAIDDGRVLLNPAGRMVDHAWRDLATRFPGTVLDAWVLMPNHLHAILTLPMPNGQTLDGCPSLSEVVGWFKTITTRSYTHGVRAEGWPPFDARLWQTSFYDHIIHGEHGLDRQRQYIAANPSRWHEDPENAPDPTPHR